MIRVYSRSSVYLLMLLGNRLDLLQRTMKTEIWSKLNVAYTHFSADWRCPSLPFANCSVVISTPVRIQARARGKSKLSSLLPKFYFQDIADRSHRPFIAIRKWRVA